MYRKLKNFDLPESGKRFDYDALITHLAGGRTIISKRYYVGQVRNFDKSAKSEELVRKQQQFLDTLKNSGFDVKTGNIMYDSGRIREKGVDVKLAIDVVVGASDDLYDTAIVLSSDTDLIPAIKYARHKRKTVEYIGFAGSPSFGMIRESSIQRILSKQDLMPFQYLKPVK